MLRFPAALLLAAACASAQELKPYRGKYAEEPECRRLMQELPARMAQSAAAMGARLGLPGDVSNVVLQFEDIPLVIKKDVALGGTSTTRVGGRAIQWITLNFEAHFGGTADLGVELDHEMTHALLRNALGARHGAIPKWVREGLAVWAAGQGKERIDFWMTLAWDKPDPVAHLLNGLESPEHSLKDYPEDYLAVAALESLKGEEGVRAFVKLLVAGKNAHDAAAGASGKTWEEFEAFAKEFATKRLMDALGQGSHAAWKRAIGVYMGAKDWPGAQDALFAVANGAHRDTWCGALAAYYFARALQIDGRIEDARTALLMFLGDEGPRTGLMDDALWNLGLCEDKLGETDAALATFDRLARDFSFAPTASSGLLKAAQICEAAGRKDEAKARYERILRDLPESKEAAEAKKRLGP